MSVLALALAGSAGALSRFLLDGSVRARRPQQHYPLGTLAINISGSLLLGLIAGLVLFHGASSEFERIAGTGFCGGYTTFSAASFETVRLAQRGAPRAALLHASATLTLCLAVAAAGLALASL